MADVTDDTPIYHRATIVAAIGDARAGFTGPECYQGIGVTANESSVLISPPSQSSEEIEFTFRKSHKHSQDDDPLLYADDVSKKRARGRPRLDTKDETAVDVRSFAPLLRPSSFTTFFRGECCVSNMYFDLASTYSNSTRPTCLPKPKGDRYSVTRKTSPGTTENERGDEQCIHEAP
jgi:hypothetical protein